MTSRREAALKRALEGGVHDVERKAFRGGATTLVSQGLRMLLQFGSVAALARLLTPRQFGLFGMVAFVTGFVALINDLGLNAATVQRQNLQERQVSALFWVNLGFSAACTLLMMAGAPLIALVFKEPSLTWVAIALAPTFVIAGATAQHGALLARCLDFGRLAAVDLVPFAVGVAAAVGAAAAGLGVWALVIQQLVFGVMRSALILAFMPWLPSRPHFGEEERAMLRFGGNVSGFRIVTAEQYGAGPYGTMFLAQLGAEVIKIEPPHRDGKDGGDTARAVGPHFLRPGESLYFQSFNLN